MSDKKTIRIKIANITDAQAIAIEDMLSAWQSLGGLGASRWTAFYADGDGNFRPRITVDGHPAQATPLVPREQKWGRGIVADYSIDFDAIAWKLRADA